MDVEELEREVERIERAVAGTRAFLDDPKFARIKVQAAKLSTRMSVATDELNVTLEDIGEALGRRHRGKCASIEFPDDDMALVFWHIGPKWGLYVLGPQGQGLQPLLNASRRIRLASVALLEDLRVQLEEEPP